MRVVKTTKSKKNFLITIILFGLLILSNYNTIASIYPNSYYTDKSPNQCYTITKNVTIPVIPPKVDVLFAFDLTPSMSGIINQVKTDANDIINELTSNYPGVSFKFGIMSHTDYPGIYESCDYSAKYGELFIDFPYKLDLELTNNQNDVNTVINNLNIGYFNGDTAEDYTRIFYESYSDPNIEWRIDAKKLLVNFGDDLPHDCNLNEGVPGTTGILTKGRDPGRNQIIGDGDDLDLQTVLSTMNSEGITLIQCQGVDRYLNYWEYWTGITGGQVYNIESSSLIDDVVNAIVSGLSNQKIYDLHLEVTTPGYQDWLTLVEPNKYDELESGETVTFKETICIPLDADQGIHIFNVSAIDGNNVNYGDQINQINVMINDPPIISNIPNQSILEGESFTQINLDDYVIDVDNTNEELIWTYTGNKELSIIINNRIVNVLTPHIDWFGEEIITFKATDPDGEYDQKNVTFFTGPINDPPVIKDIPNQIINEGESFTDINLSNYVSDVDDLTSEINWSFIGNDKLNVSINSNIATITISNQEWNGEEIITFIAADSEGATDTKSVNFKVRFVNDPPQIPNNETPRNNTIFSKNTKPGILSWDCFDIDDDEIIYSVYLRENNNTLDDNFLIGNTTNQSLQINTKFSKKYYWRIVATDSYNNSTIGPVWQFMTGIQEKYYPSASPGINNLPIADATESDIYGFIREELTFNATKSYDPTGGIIINYTWDFDDGSKGYGEVTTHLFSKEGTYKVYLTVKNDDYITSQDYVIVEILSGNFPPTKPIINGPSSGHKNIDYDFSAISTDADNDLIKYIFNWGDGKLTPTNFTKNSTTILQSHSWNESGIYEISVKALDNDTISESSNLTIYIDILPIKGIIVGNLIDLDSDGIFDVFNHSLTGQVTAVELDNGSYLIDYDNDEKWDYAHNPDTGTQKYFDFVYDKYYEKFKTKLETPDFEFISIIAILGLLIIVLKRRK